MRPAAVSQPQSISAMRGRPGLMSNYHRHNDIEVNFLVDGSMTYLFSRGRMTVPAGAFAVFWAVFPHRVITVDDSASFYCLHIPLGVFLQWRLPPEIVGEVLHGNIVVDQTPATTAIDHGQFPLWFDEISQGDPERVETVFLEIQARLRRASLSLRRHGREIDTTAPPLALLAGSDKLGVMTAYIAERYTENVTPAEVADRVGLHPKYAMSVFKKAFDMTVVEYVTQLRVSHAQRLLATTDLKIVDVALEAGFGSPSRFYEAFSRLCRCTPTRFRDDLRQGNTR